MAPVTSPIPSRGRRELSYREHCRPKLAELLDSLKMARCYVRASGHVLEDDEGRQVVDFIGGFGAALLGHNPPQLKAALASALDRDVPCHAQVSIRAASGELAAQLNELVPSPHGYRVAFTNSGAESVEAALKHAYKVHFDRVRREYERLCRVLNDFYGEAEDLGAALALPGGKKLIDFRDDLDEYNLGQFESFQDHPVVVAFKGSFHGKTSAALKVTFNKSYREGFQGLSAIQTVFVDPDRPGLIDEAVQDHHCKFLYPVLDRGVATLRSVRVTKVIGLILEPVLGEGGMLPLPPATLEHLARRKSALGIPYIIDEIQTGCWRTGTFCAFEQTPLAGCDPEYVVLSKALGGGLVKIGAALIRGDLYDPDFGILHTSTFGEDELSSTVASAFLGCMRRDQGALARRVVERGAALREALEGLQAEFPDLIREVRGRGLMLAVEFTDLAGRSPFFRLTGKQGILSLLVASYLLEYHAIRLLAPLTTMLKGNPGKKRLSILRIQPPLTVGDAEIRALQEGLREVLRVIDANDEYCLVAHLMGHPAPAEVRRAPTRHPNAWPVSSQTAPLDSRIGFLVHPTDLTHLVEYLFPSFAGRAVDPADLKAWWDSICRFVEPAHVRSDYVASNDYVLESNLVLVPYLPDYVTRDHPAPLAQEIRDKIQDAVTVAKELGDENIPLAMVGLGAYTSIATRDGLTLNDYEMPVTTGNAFTVALTYLGLRKAAQSRGLDLERSRVAVVGAGGNIGRCLAQILAPVVGRLDLIGSPRPNSLARLEDTRRLCLEAAAARPAGPEGDFPRGGMAAALADGIAGAGDLITVSTGVAALAGADLVVVATNSADRRLIRPDMVRPGAVVCCASVPSNLDPAFAGDRRCLAFDGGLALLPKGSNISFVGMPEGGMTFGCMAETLLLGFEGRNRSFARGPLRPSQVEASLRWARTHGFGLGPLRFLGRTVLD